MAHVRQVCPPPLLQTRRVAHYVRELRSRSGSTDNHATSGLKFQILLEILSTGTSVLLTDVDVVVTQEPLYPN